MRYAIQHVKKKLKWASIAIINKLKQNIKLEFICAFWNLFLFFFGCKVPVFLLQGDRLHQAAAKTVSQVVPLLSGLLHSLLSQDAIQGRNLTWTWWNCSLSPFS